MKDYREGVRERFAPLEDDSWRKQPARSRHKKRYGMEFRYTGIHHPITWAIKEYREREWRPYYQWYESAADRDKALAALRRKSEMLIHEYRPVER